MPGSPAAFDDATGVAATLGIAKALIDSGYEPNHTIVFTSHTAEEYGRTDSQFDWLIGAWWQIAHEHPAWAHEAMLYVNIEGTGLPEPTAVDSPPELRRFARRVVRHAREDGLLPYGNVWDVPRTGTEQWPWAAAGVPSLGVADAAPRYMETAYHTQHDSMGLIDRERLAHGIRLYARFVIAADRDPSSLLDLAARSRHIRRNGRITAARCLWRVHSTRAARPSIGTRPPPAGPWHTHGLAPRSMPPPSLSRGSTPATSRTSRTLRRQRTWPHSSRAGAASLGAAASGLLPPLSALDETPWLRI